MASIPVVLLNGTTADANEVMSNFNEIYSDIDQTNIGAANKTGTGKIVLDTSPTISGLTITNPVLSGTVTGTYNLAGTPTLTAATLSGTFAGTPTFSGAVTFTSAPFFTTGITLATTQRVNLNVGGTTYLTESAANTVQIVTNSTLALQLDTLNVALGNRALAIQSGQRFYLDGGGDTYDAESSANVLDRYAGGVLALRCTSTTAVIHTNSTFNTSGELTLGDLSAPSAITTGSRRSFAKAWVNSTYIGGINLAYNVSSITVHSPGEYSINFTTSFSNINYAPIVMPDGMYSVQTQNRTTNAYRFTIMNAAGVVTAADFDAVIFGT